MMEPALVNFQQYPAALAAYEVVIRNPQLFMETLEKLHLTMGTKFMIPIIGGKELDLHRLFVEVTSRGGINKIIQEKKWKDVTSVFSFPSTATNASFVLRKYYISLLHHYEQIYFFRSKGWTPPPSACLSAASSTSYPVQGPVELVGSPFEAQPNVRKRKKNTDETPRGASPVIGVIDGKFEHGYLVTVTVGTEKLKGVLYHIPEHAPVSHVSQYLSGAHNINSGVATSGVLRRRRRRKSELRKRDPSHPKPNRSGYNFFFAEQHARLKPLHPGKDREISKMIGDLWNKLSETEKAVYQERGVKDKERYRTEMEEYREKLKTSPINAIPLQQRVALPVILSTIDSHAKIEAEGGLPEPTEDGSSSEESETDEEKSIDKSVEMDASLETETGTDSGNQAEEPSVEGNGFELRKRNDDVKTTEVEGPSGKVSEVEGPSLVVPSEDDEKTSADGQ